MGNWLRDIAEEVGKWIPNEFSKTNSYSKYVQMIPVIGPYLAGAQRGLGGIDNMATAYGDTGRLDLAFRGGLSGFSGQASDPGQYGSGFMRTGIPSTNRDIWNVAGQIGNYLPGFSSDGAGGWNMNMGGWGGNPMGQLGSLINNRYIFGERGRSKTMDGIRNAYGGMSRTVDQMRRPQGGPTVETGGRTSDLLQQMLLRTLMRNYTMR